MINRWRVLELNDANLISVSCLQTGPVISVHCLLDPLYENPMGTIACVADPGIMVVSGTGVRKS